MAMAVFRYPDKTIVRYGEIFWQATGRAKKKKTERKKKRERREKKKKKKRKWTQEKDTQR
jgi:hypothetical protein